MIKKQWFKRILAVALLLLFMSPVLMKTAHFLGVHHPHHHWLSELSYENHHTDCPYKTWHFYQFIQSWFAPNFKASPILIALIRLQDSPKLLNNEFTSFLPRGPPLSYS